MPIDAIQVERAQNLWASFERKHHPLTYGACFQAAPRLDFDQIGGLSGPKDEVLTYACAATDPGVYQRWGTAPPSALLFIGQLGVGKKLLAEALATRTGTHFLRIDVPRLAIDVMHAGGRVGEFLTAWTPILEELPRLTVFFDELEFAQVEELGERRRDLPVGPIMDFLLEVTDRAITQREHLVVGATSHPDTLRHAFLAPNRFERIVEVAPIYPDDVVAVLQIHSRNAEKRAGRPLFDDVDWGAIVARTREPAPGEWVRILHAVLRRKARCEAAGEEVIPVTTEDVVRETDRADGIRSRLQVRRAGNYL